MVDYAISDIQERIFFIKDKIQRDEMKILCDFATAVNCVTFSKMKERIEEIGDTHIIKNVLDGNFERVLQSIFSRKLWSEGY